MLASQGLQSVLGDGHSLKPHGRLSRPGYPHPTPPKETSSVVHGPPVWALHAREKCRFLNLTPIF